MRHSLALFLLLTLTACSIFEPLPDGSAPTKQVPVEEIYSKAKEELNNENYESAIKLYETLQSRYPYGRYAQQALLEMAYAYHRNDEAEMAISTAEQFIKQYPNNPYVDYAYYVKGLANFRGEISIINSFSGQDPTERDPKAAQDSFAAFKDLVTRFPDSKYAPDSRLRMQYLTNALAKYELHVAGYYLRRGAHIAAANRAQGILTQYPNSPSTHDALKIMVQAYDAMGMTDLRDDARRVLKKNNVAPSTPVGEETPVGSGKSWWQFWK
jgi:outer membrane protein assembly factor BamD